MIHSSTTVDVPPTTARAGLMPAIVFLLLLLILGTLSWATDFLMMQGESTVYTATCDGAWSGNACSGRLKAAERFRFRALKAHREVLFWTVGDDTAESGRFKNCVVQDGKNWTCPVNDDLTRTIAHRMSKGLPLPTQGTGALAFHRVPKWKWVALDVGLPVGSKAAD